jgi:hypothetical protein
MDRDKRKEHVKRMTLISEMLRGGADLPLVTINFGVEYAKRLSADKILRTDVAATFNPSLAERDFKRAAEVIQKYSNAPIKVATNAVPTVPVTPTLAPKPKVPELLAHGIVVPFGSHYEYTEKGAAWRDAGKPDLGTWTPPRAPEPTAKGMPPLEAVKPEPVEARKDTLMRDVPYEQTEAGYAALGNYWREFKHEPPNDFNLKEWAKGR